MMLNRRQLLALLGGMLLTKGCVRRAPAADSDSLERKIERMLAEARGSGMACAIVGPGRVKWSKGFGLAHVEHQRPMLADTVINVASVSKTVTAAAVMQVWEQRQLSLRDDIAKHLPFPIRNPHFPEAPITLEQLLTHRSSIKDGPSYIRTYVCGDSPLALGDWLEAYFTPGGAYWSEAGNWHPWPPGTADPPAEPRPYSNVGFGLLGYLVECVTQRPFSAFCKEHIFGLLGMRHTGWFIHEIDVARHAVPYVRAPDPRSPEAEQAFRALRPTGIDVKSLPPGTLVPLCLYGFADYPDGSLRTSANELARFLAAHLAQGRAYGGRLLKPETLAVMFSGGHFGQHLCWSARQLPDGRPIIMHGGRDPGVTAFIAFEPSSRLGAVCLRNFEATQEDTYRLIALLLDAALTSLS
jgi:CubicO group peptidase (beta-lactamase class C family)